MADYAKGQLLRELRKGTRLSREKVAAEIGVTTKTLYAWENDGGIKIDNARKLAGFYGVDDVESLFTRSTDGGDQLDRIEQKLDQLIVAITSLAKGGEAGQTEFPPEGEFPELPPEVHGSSDQDEAADRKSA
jgi:transcriptional regulator with XRE-family HTH domain